MSLGPNFFGKPPPAEGAFSVAANLLVKPDESDFIRDVLASIAKSANSDAEPDCTTYRVNVADDDKNTFIVYEEYKNAAAFVHHCEQEVFKTLAKNVDKLESAHLRYFRLV